MTAATPLFGYVVVSGAPGSGKSTLAGPLAAALALPLLGKDLIKETLHDQIPPGADRAAWSKILGGAAMELLWTLAGAAPAAVLEADFRPGSEYERGRLAALNGPVVEVYCRCPAWLAAQRYAARHTGRHPAHVSGEISLQQLAQFDRPMAVGPVVEVDTTAPVDIETLANRLPALLKAPRP